MPIDVYHIRSGADTATRDSPGVIEGEVEWEGETARIWFKPRDLSTDTLMRAWRHTPETTSGEDAAVFMNHILDYLNAVLVDWEFQQPKMQPDPEDPDEWVPVMEPNPHDPEGELAMVMEFVPLKRKSLRRLEHGLLMELWRVVREDQGPNSTPSTESSDTSSVRELTVISPNGTPSSPKLNGGGQARRRGRS